MYRFVRHVRVYVWACSCWRGGRSRTVLVPPSGNGAPCPATLTVLSCTVAPPATCLSNVTNTCANGVLDAPPETDVDCGGNSTCSRCGESQLCSTSTDCASNLQCGSSGTCVGEFVLPCGWWRCSRVCGGSTAVPDAPVLLCACNGPRQPWRAGLCGCVACALLTEH